MHINIIKLYRYSVHSDRCYFIIFFTSDMYVLLMIIIIQTVVEFLLFIFTAVLTMVYIQRGFGERLNF